MQAAALGLSFLTQMRDVILPQALRIAVPPTVGFLTQLVKATALASIVGFNELLKSGRDRHERHVPAAVHLWAGGADLFRDVLSTDLLRPDPGRPNSVQSR